MQRVRAHRLRGPEDHEKTSTLYRARAAHRSDTAVRSRAARAKRLRFRLRRHDGRARSERVRRRPLRRWALWSRAVRAESALRSARLRLGDRRIWEPAETVREPLHLRRLLRPEDERSSARRSPGRGQRALESQSVATNWSRLASRPWSQRRRVEPEGSRAQAPTTEENRCAGAREIRGTRASELSVAARSAIPAPARRDTRCELPARARSPAGCPFRPCFHFRSCFRRLRSHRCAHRSGDLRAPRSAGRRFGLGRDRRRASRRERCESERGGGQSHPGGDRARATHETLHRGARRCLPGSARHRQPLARAALRAGSQGHCIVLLK